MATDLPALAVLLAPISEAAPAGADPRLDYTQHSLYYRLRDARADARAAERAGDADPDAVSEAGRHWREVAKLAAAALGEQGKDLEIAAWLIEALVRRDGVARLAFGARLIEGLADRYWDTLYPRPDEEGVATLVSPITGLNGESGDGTLVQPLRKHVLFTRPDGAALLFFQYQQAEEVAGIGDEARRAARIKAGVAEFTALDAEAKAAGPAAFAPLAAQLDDAIAAWGAMARRLDEKAGQTAPPISRIAGLLADMQGIVRRYSPAVAILEAQVAPAPYQSDDLLTGAAAPSQQRQALTREEALRQLGELAAFFRRTEPQSPISLTIEEAIRRARMSWPELLADITADPQIRHSMLLALGIRPG